MKLNKWSIIFLLVLIVSVFLSWEFFITSRMNLDVSFIFPDGISDDVEFEMRIYSEEFDNKTAVFPHDKEINYSSMPFGDYFFELYLDDRLIIKEFHNFQSQFSIKRAKEQVALDISELATITSVNYKIVDPYLTIKWTGKYLGAYKPAEYLVYLNNNERLLSVNYLELDVLKELLEGEQAVDIRIIPLTQSGGKLLSFEYQVPIRMESVRLDIPEGFNIYDMSINIQEKRIPIDPYDSRISFPVIDLSENSIPFEIYYYEDRIWKSELDLSEVVETIKIPDIPQATVTEVDLDESTVTVHLNIDREKEFLYNRFKYFEISSDTINTTATEYFTYNNDNQNIYITPLFEPDIQGETLLFTIPQPPIPHLHTYMFDENLDFAPSIKIYSDSFLKLHGDLQIDNTLVHNIPEFNGEYLFELDFEKDEVHLIEISLEDIYGQTAQKAKWISTSVPETSFFIKAELNKNQILDIKWDSLTIYQETELIITDNYNIKRFYPEESGLQIDLSGTLLREPLRVILKGFLNGDEYTAAVIEGIRSE